MNSNEIRRKFLEFFEKRGHTVVPSSSLIPDDPSVLLTTAGMQQFKPYYIGKADAMKDFGSLNAASVQKSFRTSDIDEVGDESHLTFFEMLGNFSFGGYFKKEAIQYGYEFFKELKLPIEYVTVFGGDAEIPADEESEKIWRDLGVTDIRRKGREDNFWGPTGSEGPCGPTTEIYANGVEIWNIVFNQYYCKPDKTFVPLEKSGVDTGMGLERLAMVLQKKKNIFETDLFLSLLFFLPASLDEKTRRVIVDHARGVSFLLADGVRPSNKGAGYILRRLMRRVMAYEKVDGVSTHIFDALLHEVVHEYGMYYPELLENGEILKKEIDLERQRFTSVSEAAEDALEENIINKAKDVESRVIVIRMLGELRERKRKQIGLTEIGTLYPIEFWDLLKATRLSGEEASEIQQRTGAPLELIIQLTRKYNILKVDEPTFWNEAKEAFSKHQEVSRAGLEKKFGGHGLLLDTGELKAADEAELKKVTRLHTATHLLNAALRKVLNDPNIRQDGSDITAERTRFDFSFPRKLTPEEIQKIENVVNEVVAKNMEVAREEMLYQDAVKSGALHFFREKYPDRVSVYTVRDKKTGEVFSKELCGGPHVSRTGEIGRFKIIKEESSSAGVRRIRATVE